MTENFNTEADVAIAKHHLVKQAQKAFNAGEIEQWLEFHRPKSLEDWDTYDALYPRGTFSWDDRD